MKIIIYRNREVYKENSKIGNDSENKVETLEFEFPEEFKDFNKYIEFQIKGEKCIDLIRNNQYVITRNIAKYGKIKTQIVLKKIIDNDTVVFKSDIFTVKVSASINASEEIEQTLQVDIIQTLSQNISEIESKVLNLEENKVNRTEIPTKTSDLTNDSGFIDETYHDNTKVDKEENKGLSTNDYTDEDKNKLESLENYDDTELRNSILNLNNDKADKTEIPIVPSWAKQEEKPTYTASEIAFEDGETFQEKYDTDKLKGTNGKSAYEIWLEKGNEGTEEEFIDSLNGKNGVGVPVGGTAGQVLVKKSDTDYDTEWVNQNTEESSSPEEGTMIYKGTWNSTDIYKQYDVVEYGNLFFMALSNIAANQNPNSNPTLWKKMNYTSNYSNVQTTTSSSVHYISGTSRNRQQSKSCHPV